MQFLSEKIRAVEMMERLIKKNIENTKIGR